jgi:YidC/Oxa1 family membrane protein insertase
VDIITQAMLFMLTGLHSVLGNYGLAIIALTVLIRLAVWPMNSAQTRSMKKMQELQPKIKALQERYKDEPQKMQAEMMKFYAENKFNPFAGCLPLLIQLPIFIGLFGALNSPEFLIASSNERFYFIDKLYHTLHSHAGEPMDNLFQVQENDTFSSGKHVTLVMKDGNKVEKEVRDLHKVISFSPKPLLPGSPVNFSLNWSGLGVEDPVEQKNYSNMVDRVEMIVVNDQSKELEKLELKNADGILSLPLPTKKAPDNMDISSWHLDVLYLILAYAVLSWLYSKVTQPKQTAAASDDPQAAAQAKMMKLMPLMFVVMLFFFPLPAGVMIYLVVTTAMMFAQTAWVNYSEDKKKLDAGVKPSEKVIEISAK